MRRVRVMAFLAHSAWAARRFRRRLVTRSWTLSRWYYRWHRLELRGRGSDLVWYFAYGSNMHDSAFRERRRMGPLEWGVGRLAGYRLRFNLDATPRAARPRGISVPMAAVKGGACSSGSPGSRWFGGTWRRGARA